MPIFDYNQLIIHPMDPNEQYALICKYIDELRRSSNPHFHVKSNSVCNPVTKIAMYCKIAGCSKKTKKGRLLQIQEDREALYVTTKILHNNIRSFFNAKPQYKLLVNFVCNQHTMAVLISRRPAFTGKYTFKMYNCNHSLDGYTGVIDAFKKFYPRNNLIEITTRTRSNWNGYCLAYTWCYMYDIYMGVEH
jgi:hypothetical protein